MSIIGLNLEDNQFAHIKSFKRPTEVCHTLYNIYKMKIAMQVCYIQGGKECQLVSPR